MEKSKDIKSIALELFEQSHEEFLNYPIDFNFISYKINLLTDTEYLCLLVYTLDNFPQLYVNRFIMITSYKMLNFNNVNWKLIFESISTKGGINTIYSFIYSYLNLLPGESYKSNYSCDYIYQKDEDDLFETPFINDTLSVLKEKMLKIDFINRTT